MALQFLYAIPTIDMARAGQNIKHLRVQAGLSIRDLQNVFGFSTPQALYKWQHGAALPTIDNMVILASTLGVKIDDILVLDADNTFAAYRSDIHIQFYIDGPIV